MGRKTVCLCTVSWNIRNVQYARRTQKVNRMEDDGRTGEEVVVFVESLEPGRNRNYFWRRRRQAVTSPYNEEQDD